MFRIIMCLLLVLSIGSYTQICNAKQNEQNTTKTRYKSYIRNKKEIKKQELIKTKKQRELEYIEKKLENKKQKLEKLTIEQEKGEKE